MTDRRRLDLFAPPPTPAPPRLPSAAYRTYTGVMLDFGDPEHAVISIEDIGHQLARICRYSGAMDGYYSVASHCVYVSRCLEARGHSPYLQAAGLLHDATEAYLGDVVSGLKRLLPDYRALEVRWENAVQKYFDVYWHQGAVRAVVKDADLRARLSEVRDLFSDYPYPRELLLGGEGDRQPFEERVVEQTPDEAEWAWLARARELGLW